jgi:hypothetical protein
MNGAGVGYPRNEILHLSTDFVDSLTVAGTLVRKYADYVGFPVML